MGCQTKDDLTGTELPFSSEEDLRREIRRQQKKLDDLAKINKLASTINQLCINDKRSVQDVLLMLQFINDHPGWTRFLPSFEQLSRNLQRNWGQAFLPLKDQLWKFWEYNSNFLQVVYPDYAISGKDYKEMEGKLKDLPPQTLLFYSHQNIHFEVMAALKYAAHYGRSVLVDERIVLDKEHLRLHEAETQRPTGFYAMTLEPEDKEALGLKHRGLSGPDLFEKGIIGKPGSSWGMAAECFQFLLITHQHYPELMDGKKFPFIGLPGFVYHLSWPGTLYFEYSNGLLGLRRWGGGVAFSKDSSDSCVTLRPLAI